MSREVESAVRYLRRPHGAFWWWSDDGDLIAWADGPTIVFRVELAEILRRFEGRGLPPLGAVVLLLAACRDNWPAERARLGSELIFRVFGLSLVPGTLDAVLRFPHPLRSTTDGKAEIVATVFETSETSSDAPGPAEARTVVRMLAEGLPVEVYTSCGPQQRIKDLALELRPLREGLRQLDPEALELRLRTGLERSVTSGPPELSLPERVRRLLSQLERDSELAGLARLARNLMAVAHLPRRLSEPDDLPLGGVSDISNRGPLDRLLLSELAHDETTLMTRVALNEALYVRREAPPRHPPAARVLLVDAGLRLWGVPRVFATSAALSLAAVGDRDLSVEAFRPSGDEAAPVDLLSRSGLVTHLSALEADVHPGAALPAFAKRLAASGKAAEPVIITADEVIADPGFQSALAGLKAPLVYLAAVSRSGRFRLLARTIAGTRLLREARMDVEVLLAPPRERSTPLVDARRDPSLPLILSVRPFPLLLSAPLDPRRAWHVQGVGAFTLPDDGRLLFWTDRRHGAEQLAEGIAAGRVLWHSLRPSGGVVRALLHREGDDRLTLLHIDVETRACGSTTLRTSGRSIKGAADCDGGLMVFGPGTIEALDPATGVWLGAERVDPWLVWNYDRFFIHQKSGEWHVPAWTGGRIHFTRIVTSEVHKRHSFIRLFSQDGREGPIGFTAAGAFYDLTEQRVLLGRRTPDAAIRLVGISRDGQRALLRDDLLTSVAGGRQLYLADLRAGTTTSVWGAATAQLEPQLARTVRVRSLSHQFRNIFRDEDGLLVLFSRSGTFWRVEYDERLRALCFRKQPSRTSLPPTARGFEPVRGTDYNLRAAQWTDRSRAYLDSRGLLHLKSADPAVPEVTLVLHEGVLAGWCSDGEVWGNDWFVRTDPSTTADVVHRKAVQEFARRLR